MKRHVVVLSVLAATLLAACATEPMGVTAAVDLKPRSGSTVNGTASFMPIEGGLRVEAHIVGLTPGQHGFHIHEVGDCSAADASSAKGHFNPTGHQHGQHGGDMPNLVADAKGEARYVFDLRGATLNNVPESIRGRSLVVHADPDDYKSQPAGNAGARVACGVIPTSY